ncbi:uncharacterized protein EKO05_0007466 [Ascochyta rabiei]|nr:uncharacterized protein EKO05_0007466 [Ascochyta rabiei]UPX17090.1 hypothetical protein EKO05_0007466 [Ascochyta rabiei]
MHSCETCRGDGIKGTVCPTCGHPDPEAKKQQVLANVQVHDRLY